MENNPLEGFTVLFGLSGHTLRSIREEFTVLFLLTQAAAAMILSLMMIWLTSYRGGFAWTSDPKIQFNWHPLLMTIGMIFLYANAILVYRAFRGVRKRKLKIAHATLSATALVISVIGLKAVFDAHNLATPPIPNLYSLHSLLGILSVVLFAFQWVAGLVSFLYPTLSAPLRATYFPVHVFFGINIFVCSISSALLGLTEKAFISVSKFTSEGFLINFMGIILVMFGGLVVHLVSHKKFKREPLPEDELLLTGKERIVENNGTDKKSVENGEDRRRNESTEERGPTSADFQE